MTSRNASLKIYVSVIVKSEWGSWGTTSKKKSPGSLAPAMIVLFLTIPKAHPHTLCLTTLYVSEF